MSEIRVAAAIILIASWFGVIFVNFVPSDGAAPKWIYILFATFIGCTIFLLFRSYSAGLFIFQKNSLLGMLYDRFITPFSVLFLPLVAVSYGVEVEPVLFLPVGLEHLALIALFFTLYVILNDRNKIVQSYILGLESVKSLLLRDLFLTNYPPKERGDLLGYDIFCNLGTIIGWILLFKMF